MTGKIKFFSHKGYGFIISDDDGKEYFYNLDSLSTDYYLYTPKQDEPCTFEVKAQREHEIRQGMKPMAINVRFS